MKKTNKSIFNLLFLLALGSSSHMILPMDEEEEFVEDYQFVSKNYYTQAELDATDDIDSESDSDTLQSSNKSYGFKPENYAYNQFDANYYHYDSDSQISDNQEDDIFPSIAGVSYTSPDTFVVTEAVTLDTQTTPRDFYGSEHERRMAAHDAIQHILATLEATDRDLNQTEHQLENLDNNSHKNETMQEESLQSIEQDIDQATDTLTSVSADIRSLALSTDKSVQSQFNKSQGTITRSHNKTINELEKVRKKLDNQSKKTNRQIRKALKIK